MTYLLVFPILGILLIAGLVWLASKITHTSKDGKGARRAEWF